MCIGCFGPAIHEHEDEWMYGVKFRHMYDQQLVETTVWNHLERSVDEIMSILWFNIFLNHINYALARKYAIIEIGPFVNIIEKYLTTIFMSSFTVLIEDIWALCLCEHVINCLRRLRDTEIAIIYETAFMILENECALLMAVEKCK